MALVENEKTMKELLILLGTIGACLVYMQMKLHLALTKIKKMEQDKIDAKIKKDIKVLSDAELDALLSKHVSDPGDT